MGLRLAIYDEALAAGPLGIGRDTLLWAVQGDMQRLAVSDAWPDFEWLVQQRVLLWMDNGLLRARSRNDLQLPTTPAPRPLPRTPTEQHFFEIDAAKKRAVQGTLF